MSWHLVLSLHQVHSSSRLSLPCISFAFMYLFCNDLINYVKKKVFWAFSLDCVMYTLIQEKCHLQHWVCRFLSTVYTAFHRFRSASLSPWYFIDFFGSLLIFSVDLFMCVISYFLNIYFSRYTTFYFRSKRGIRIHIFFNSSICSIGVSYWSFQRVNEKYYFKL